MSNPTLTNGYISVLAPISLTEPSDLFLMQDKISNEMNDFQKQYSRYVKCQDLHFAGTVTDPPCDTIRIDNYANLEKAYQQLSQSIQDVSHAFVNQIHSPDAKTPQQYENSLVDLAKQYASVVQLRNDLDKKLKSLYDEQSSSPDTSVKQLESAVYANTLWTILATILIYFIFIGV